MSIYQSTTNGARQEHTCKKNTTENTAIKDENAHKTILNANQCCPSNFALLTHSTSVCRY